eukprot:929753_1
MATDTTDTEDQETDNRVVIIDNGSGMMKAGFSGDDAPRAVFPSMVGRPRHKGVMVGMTQSDCYVGDEARAKRGILCLKRPFQHGVVVNWDDTEKIWHHTFYNELRIAPEEHTVLLTEAALNPKRNREKMTQIIFETFGAPSFYVANQSALSLFAEGKLNGTVIQSGYDVTNIVPCYEGIALRDAVVRLDLGGENVTEYLIKLLNERGYLITNTSSEREVVADIKKKLGFIALDYNEALYKGTFTPEFEVDYELPDGLMLAVSSERFQCAEVLFDPRLIGLEQDGIHHGLCNSIKKCDKEMQCDLFENIVFSGGNTMFDGIDERLLKEVKALVSNKTLVDGYLRQNYVKQSTNSLYKDIVDLLNDYTSFQPKLGSSQKGKRMYLPWIGGSVVASTSEFENVCITMDEYNESGPQKMLVVIDYEPCENIFNILAPLVLF